jgi:hypothetical protein
MLYPVLTQSRLLSDLSGVWNFKLDNGKGFEEKWETFERCRYNACASFL